MSAAVAKAGVNRFLVRAGVFVLLLAGLALLLRVPLAHMFRASPHLNGLIIGLFVSGIGYTLGRFGALRREHEACVRVERLAADVRTGVRSAGEAGELMVLPSLGDVGRFLARVRLALRHAEPALTLPLLLDSLAGRGEDARALLRFLAAALVLIGLVGTFHGLLQSTEGVRELLATTAAGEGGDWLAGLRARLATPLIGMGTGFASALFGLACSVALGFLELQLFHAQHAVAMRLETLVISELLPIWQTPAECSREPPSAPHALLELTEAMIGRLDRVAGLLEAAGARDDAGRIAQAVMRADERAQAYEREQAALVHELRILAHALAHGGAAPSADDRRSGDTDAPAPR